MEKDINNKTEFGLPEEIDVKITNKIKKPKPTFYDAIMSIVIFAIAWFFSRQLLFVWSGWGVTAFTVAYLTAGITYLKMNLGSIKKSSWFWFTATLINGISYAMWQNTGIAPLRTLALFVCAVYWVVEAADCNIGNGNFFPLDCLNAFIIVPFCNIFNQFHALSGFKTKNGAIKKQASIIIGVVLSLLLLFVLVPPLMQADSGAFSSIFRGLAETAYNIYRYFNMETFVFYLIPTIPVSAYIFGLFSGGANGTHTRHINADTVKNTLQMRFLPQLTVLIALTALLGLYVLFIVCQIPFYFSAFTNRLPVGWLTYSEYARHGFFELIRISVINIIIMLSANFLCKTKTSEFRMLRVYNILISAITLVLLLTAFSKMLMYVSEYGLTMLRLLPCVFMLFLAGVFIAVIILQKYRFDIARFAILFGISLFTILCVINPDAIVVNYNVNRYLNGTLNNCDAEIFRRAGTAGVLPAIRVYENTKDENTRADLNEFIINDGYMRRSGYYLNGTRSSYETITAKNKQEEFLKRTPGSNRR